MHDVLPRAFCAWLGCNCRHSQWLTLDSIACWAAHGAPKTIIMDLNNGIIVLDWVQGTVMNVVRDRMGKCIWFKAGDEASRVRIIL